MLPEAYDVTGKVVFITGAGRGIGKGIAQVLAEAGADVALNALTPRYVEPTADEIARASGRRVIPVIADVTKSEGVQQAIDTVIETLGRIDVLVNNLGDAIRKPLVALPEQTDVGALSDDELNFVMDVNLTEAILCTRAVGPHMLERRSGKVINISSWTARQGGGEMVVYTIAKTALVGFTRAQALEWAPYGVQVNAIAPGIFRWWAGIIAAPLSGLVRVIILIILANIRAGFICLRVLNLSVVIIPTHYPFSRIR
ncbi:2-deoxy-D-gluconate 3-dehydrogenase [Candidatus Entotheonella serta]|nr:2-deoxy-D-gluconate 3-dehydrogenase [Candidatus Entotheonella serta]